MITVSDNESYNELVRRHGGGSFVKGTAVVNQYLKKNGYTRTGCHSSLHPSSSSCASDGGRNTASAKDCGKLLEQIYRGKCVSKQYSKEMLNLLLHLIAALFLNISKNLTFPLQVLLNLVGSFQFYPEFLIQTVILQIFFALMILI